MKSLSIESMFNGGTYTKLCLWKEFKNSRCQQMCGAMSLGLNGIGHKKQGMIVSIMPK
jgi:hypothetical protein